MVLRLQLIYEKKIMLISCGAFYIAVGSDAVMLHRKLGLKLNCAKRNLCKVGIPKNSIYKYLKQIEELGYACIILEYDKNNNELKKRYEKEGKDKEIYLRDNNCNNCINKRNIPLTEYEQALSKYIKKEFGEKYIC